MTSSSDQSLSSLLEKANYIKKAMGDIEQEITNNTFSIKTDNVQVTMKGTGIVDKILVDPEAEQLNIEALTGQIKNAVNKAIHQIEQKRQEAFKIISQNIQEEEPHS